MARKMSTVFSLPSHDSSLSAKELDENPFKKGGKLVRYEQPREQKVLQRLPSVSEVTGLNLEDNRFRLGVPFHFTLHCGELGKGNLKVACQPSKGAKIKVKPEGSHSYACTITPLQLGSHEIQVHYGHIHISGSPFRVTFNPPGNASACKVVETYPECQQRAKVDEMVFCISTKDAGEGTLSASVKNTATKQHLPVEITAGTDLDLDHFNMRFTLAESTRYVLSVKYDKQHIQGSPFMVVLSDASKCRTEGKGLKSAIAEKENTFLVRTEEAGPGTLDVQIEGDGCTVDSSISSTTENEHMVTYVPPMPGTYKISVTWGGEGLPGSPFEVTCLVGPDAGKCIVTGPSVPIETNKPVELRVDASNAGNGQLVAKAVGDTAGPTNVKINEVEPNVFNISLNPTTLEGYTLTVTWGDMPISGSPFHLNLFPFNPSEVKIIEFPSTLLQAGHPIKVTFDTSKAGRGQVAASCEGKKVNEIPVTITQIPNTPKYSFEFTPPLEDVYSLSIQWGGENIKGSPFIISLVPLDVSKIETNGPRQILGRKGPVDFNMYTDEAGVGKVTATCLGTNTGTVPVEIKKTATDSYHLSFQPPQADTYTFDVCYGGQRIPGSPYHVNTHSANASKIKVIKPEKIQVGRIVTTTCDCTLAGAGEIRASCIGEKYGAIELDVTKYGIDHFDITFNPILPDIFTLSITWGGEGVPGFPFRVNLLPPDPEKVIVGELHIPDKAGTKDLVWLDLDCSHTGPGEVKAECRGESVGEVQVDIETVERDKYKVTFLPKPDKYKLSVYYADKHVPNSPFLFNLIPPQPDKVEHTATSLPEEKGAPAVLSFDTSQAGRGVLTAKAVGESAGPVPVQVRETAPNDFDVLLQSPMPDVYTVNVYWEEKPVKGSPFIINLLPPDAGKVKVSEPKTVACSTPLVYKCDTRDAGAGDVTATCEGKESGNIDVAVLKHPSSQYEVSFTLVEPDIYTLSIKWAGEEVPKSPFKINLLPPDPEKVIVGELHIPDEAGTKDPVWLDLDCSHTGPGEVKTECLGESVGEVQVDIETVERDKYKVTFLPKPDKYKLSVYYADKHVPNSPFLFNLIPPQPDKVEHTATSLPEEKGAPAVLSFDTSQAGRGGLTAKAVGESVGPVPVQVKETAPNDFNVLLESPTPDVYTVDVYWEEKPVKGSPFIINLLPPDAGKVKVSEPKTVACSTPLVYKCDTRDAGAGDVTATCEGKENGNIDVAVLKHPSSQYDVSFTLVEPDIYTLSIKWAGEEVPKSPFKINLLPPDPEKVIVGELHIPDEAGTKDPVWLDLDCSHTGPGEVKAECRGESVGEVQVDIETVERDKYKVTFLPKPDKYKLSVYYADKHVPNSPFLFNLIPPQPDKVEHTATSLPEEKGAPAVLSFDTSQAGRGGLTAKAVGESVGPVPVQVKETAPNDFNVLLQSPTPDVYTVDVYWEEKPVKGSPFTINTMPLDVSKIKVNGPIINSQDGTVELTLWTKGAGPGKVKVSCIGSKAGTVDVSSKEGWDSLTDCYHLSFQPPQPDAYSFGVWYGGRHIPGSPFYINTNPPDAGQVKVTEPKAIKCSKPLVYHCDAKHAGAGDITATCEGVEHDDIEIYIKKHGAAQYEVSFILVEPDIYTLSIKWAGEEVPKSPFKINLLPPDPEKVIVGELHIPDKAGTKDPVWLDLDCSHTGPGTLRVGCEGETVGKVQVNVRLRDSDVYRVKFLPKTGDMYTLSLHYGSGEVPGSPFTIDLLPSYPENVKLTATTSPKEAGGPFSLTFDTSKAGKGSLNAIAMRKSGGPIPTEVKHDGTHAYEVLFTPLHPDVYKVAVYWVDVPVKDSPFTVDARHPEDVQCSEPSFTKVGEPVSMTVDISKAGPGNITAKCSGKLCGTVPIEITATTSSLYTLSFLPKRGDVYSISVLYNGTEVKDSPFEADLCPHTPVEEVVQTYMMQQQEETINIPDELCQGDIVPSQDDEELPNGLVCYVGEPFTVMVETDQAELTATAAGENSGSADINISNLPDDNFEVSFNPEMPDRYTIDIYLNGKAIPGSPYTMVYIMPSDPSQCRILMTEDQPKIYQTHQEIHFGVDATKAGNGKLQVTADGPSRSGEAPKLYIKSKEGNPAIYDITYVPSAAGLHTVYLLWSGKVIPGSPIAFEVGSTKAIYTYEYGKPIVLETYTSGDMEDLESYAVHEQSESRHNVDISKVEKGRFKLGFQPEEPGIYAIHVLLKGRDIQGSPYHVEYAKPPKPDACKVTGLSSKGSVGHPLCFTVDIREAGSGDLKVKASRTTTNKKDFTVTNNEDGTYSAVYIPSGPGDIRFDITWAGKAVPGSPFKVKVSTTIPKLTKQDSKPAASMVYIDENDQHIFGKVLPFDDPAHFSILTRGAGHGTLNIISRGPGKADVKIQNKNDGTYSCEFAPSLPGKYYASILWNNHHIPGSPYLLNFSSSEKSYMVEGLDLENVYFRIGIPHKFKIICGEGDLKVTCRPQEAASISLESIAGGSYRCEIVPHLIGNHTVSVLYNDRHILGSPFQVHFEASGDASKCHITDHTIDCEQEGLYKATFYVTTEAAGNGGLIATAENVISKENAPVSISEVSENHYCVHTTIGEGKEYVVSIKYDQQHIQGSPFKLAFDEPPIINSSESDSDAIQPTNQDIQMPPKPENVKAYGPGLDNGCVGQEGNFTVETGEGGAGTLAVRVHGPQGAFKINMRRHPENERTILVRYDPTHVGLYTVDITWSDVHIPGSPFKVDIAEQRRYVLWK